MYGKISPRTTFGREDISDQMSGYYTPFATVTTTRLVTEVGCVCIRAGHRLKILIPINLTIKKFNLSSSYF